MDKLLWKLPLAKRTTTDKKKYPSRWCPSKAPTMPSLADPAFATFMARPCYVYSKLKIPVPNGVITVSGSYKKARECELGNAVFAEAVISKGELARYLKKVKQEHMPDIKKPPTACDVTFTAGSHSKKAKIDDKDAEKTKNIGTTLSDK